MVTGPGAEAWDLAFIAEYPTSEAFLAMIRDPEYRELVKHRHRRRGGLSAPAAFPTTPGEGFGE